MAPKKIANGPTLSVLKSQTGEETNQGVLTGQELLLYFDDLESSLIGLADLAKMIAGGEGAWSDGMLGHYVFQVSGDKLSEITRRVSERLSKNVYEQDAQTTIAEAEVDEYETALGPVCSFVEFASHGDLDNDRVSANLGAAGRLVHRVALEGLNLMRSRLKEGGAA